jgi:hypothetical protein
MRTQTLGHRRFLATASGFLVLAGVFGTYTPAASETTIGEVSRDTTTVTIPNPDVAVCYRNDGEKLVRVVESEDGCGEHETFVRLSPGERGADGPQGPQGPSGDGKASSRWYADRDDDGYGDWYDRVDSAVRPAGFADNNDDCNDDKADVNPGTGRSSGRGEDFDCDGLAAELSIRWFPDADGDGWGGLPSITNQASKPNGYTRYPHDCNDNDPTIYPGSDLDAAGGPGCNRAREGQRYNADQDQDGHHHLWFNGDDCNDFDREIHPGALERTYDGLDNDCEGSTLDVEPYVDDVGRHDPKRWGWIAPYSR